MNSYVKESSTGNKFEKHWCTQKLFVIICRLISSSGIKVFVPAIVVAKMESWLKLIQAYQPSHISINNLAFDN